MNATVSRFMYWVGGCLTAFILTTGSTFAVHDLNLFELDGNAIENNINDDWETLDDGGGSSNVFTGIVPDPAPQTIFDGGKKDIQQISNWSWKNGAVPDKSDITNAYAAAYDDNGDLIVYFGADRFSNVGDTFLGFWFFKGEVNAEPDGTFSGEHQIGDVLVLVNFPQANNAVPLIQVVEWDTTCNKADSNNPQVGDCAAKNLRLRAGVSGPGAICGSNSNDLVCAITNTEGGPNDPTPSPWSYTSKDGFVNEFPFETFFEGGINLSQLVGGEACFSSFMAETRSSSSFTASLKDFVIDSFPVCGVSVDKNCSNPRINDTGDMIIYDISGTVTNDGFGTIFNIAVEDSPPADFINFVNCNTQDPQDPSSLAGGESICYVGEITVPFDQNGLMDMVTVTANTSPDNSGTVLSDTADATCPVLQISPALSLTKACTSSVILDSAMVVAKVSVSGEICNVGDSKVTNVSVVDDKAGILLSGVTLVAPDDPQNPGNTPGACAPYSGMYKPSEANDISGQPTTDPSLVIFKDTATGSGTDIFGNPVTPQPVMATCPLCPPHEE